MKRNLRLIVGMVFTVLVLNLPSFAQYNKLHDFTGINDGFPYGSLTPGGNGFYGMTAGGTTNNWGNIFYINADGTGYRDLYDFTASTGGAEPHGSLTLSGGVLYGITNEGGAGEQGNIFSIDTDGSGYSDLHDFTYRGDPYGSLTLVGGSLYGMTTHGDSGAYTLGGNIFGIDVGGGNFRVLLDFPAGMGSNGSLTALSNTLYGMAWGGLVADSAFIFSINSDGSNYRVLYSTAKYGDGPPEGSLTIAGNMLYGMLSFGGTNGLGNIFSIDTDGSNYEDLHDFDGINGSEPFGSLTLSNNVLYGMTSGDNWQIGNDFTGFSYGNIFSINVDGSGYHDWLDFVTDSMGTEPYADLAVSGNTLYGMTNAGGDNSVGVVFSYQPCAVPQPGILSGPAIVITDSTYTYSIPAMSGITSYTWWFPPGWNFYSDSNVVSAQAGSSGAIIVKANDSCGASLEDSLFVTVDVNAGINEVKAPNGNYISAYPNPFGNTLAIEYNIASKTNGLLILTDVLGRELKNIELNNQSGKIILNTSDLPAGVIIGSLYDGDVALISKKLIKME